MLQPFDWVRKSRTGAELIATVNYLNEIADDYQERLPEFGSPVSALDRPCKRCWIYAREPGYNYCRICLRILLCATRCRDASRNAVVLWAAVNRIPDIVTGLKADYAKLVYGSIILPDSGRFLLLLHRLLLTQWIRDLFVYHGDDIKGLLQIFPTVGVSHRGDMGDLIIRAAHHDSRFPPDMLRVRFFHWPYDLFAPHQRDDKGLLTFDIRDFFRLLETASIFRSLIKPHEQKILLDLAHINDVNEEHFYWGRFLGMLTPEAKDMLTAWNFRQWPANRIELLYNLLAYVPFNA